ncbi:MAG: DUF3592 domain-containing protein [Ktedonobacteraceae bacterium]|nr:DUF3592 domain-containing protein [Ktedonobacteraceae bacterium]
MLSYPAPPQPRKSAPGCNLIGLAIGAILFLGFMAFLFLLALPFLRLLASPLMSFYEEGHCTITNTHVEINDSDDSTTYRPQIAFVLRTIDGRSYQTAGYDWLQLDVPDQDRAQAIAHKFVLGKTYVCWYNPWYPSWTILTRDIDWSTIPPSSGFWISGIFCSLVLCTCLFGLMRKLPGLFRRRRKYTFSIGGPQI